MNELNELIDKINKKDTVSYELLLTLITKAYNLGREIGIKDAKEAAKRWAEY